MMDYLIENFVSFAGIYAQIIINLYLFGVAVLFALWLKPFTRKHISAYLAPFVYCVLMIGTGFVETSRGIGRIINLSILVITFLILWLFDNRRNPIQKIFLCAIFRLISWLSLELFIEIGYFETELINHFEWYKYSIEATVIEFIVWNMLEYALPIVLLYAVIRILQKAYRLKFAELTWQELIVLVIPMWTIFLVKPIMASYFYLWMDGIKNGNIHENIPGNPYRVIFLILSLMTVVIEVFLFEKLKDKHEEEYATRSVENQKKDTYRHVGHIEDMYEKMRAMRHDIGNHLTVIEGLAQNGKTYELVEYIGELQDRFDEIQPSVKTGNAVTDVILSEVSEQCAKNRIVFEIGFVYPEGLKINPFDMSVILTNALQNAIEATKNTTDPKISIVSVVKARFFIICVKNTVSNKVSINEEGIPESTKTETGHGYGLKNIRSIARKYKGDIDIRQDETDGGLLFVLNIMLMG